MIIIELLRIPIVIPVYIIKLLLGVNGHVCIYVQLWYSRH